MRIVQAALTTENLATVIRLRRDAVAWLRSQGQDQWSNDWPDTDTMIAGFLRDLQEGGTWIAFDDDIETDKVLGAVTINRRTNPGLWKPEEEATSLFVHRLTLAQGSAGRGIGARLLDFAGQQAEHVGLPWIRLDAWTTNDRLHQYYRRQGFRLVRMVPNHHTPSAACFERPSAQRGAELLKPGVSGEE